MAAYRMLVLVLALCAIGCGQEAPHCTATFPELGVSIVADGLHGTAWCASVEDAQQVMTIHVGDANTIVAVTLPEPDSPANVGVALALQDDGVSCAQWARNIGIAWEWGSGDFDPGHWHVRIDAKCATSPLELHGDLIGNVYYRGK